MNQVSVEEFGEVKTHTLKEDGENLAVTNENREGKWHVDMISMTPLLLKSNLWHTVT